MQRFTYVISLHGLSDIHVAIMLELKLAFCELQSYISLGPTLKTDMSIRKHGVGNL